jgi:hypothetical protein
MYTRVYTLARVYTCVYMYTRVLTHTHVYIHVHVYTCTHVYTCVHVHVHVCTRADDCLAGSTCVCRCLHPPQLLAGSSSGSKRIKQHESGRVHYGGCFLSYQHHSLPLTTLNTPSNLLSSPLLIIFPPWHLHTLSLFFLKSGA